jgi:hypothetical protein
MLAVFVNLMIISRPLEYYWYICICPSLIGLGRTPCSPNRDSLSGCRLVNVGPAPRGRTRVRSINVLNPPGLRESVLSTPHRLMSVFSMMSPIGSRHDHQIIPPLRGPVGGAKYLTPAWLARARVISLPLRLCANRSFVSIDIYCDLGLNRGACIRSPA